MTQNTDTTHLSDAITHLVTAVRASLDRDESARAAASAGFSEALERLSTAERDALVGTVEQLVSAPHSVSFEILDETTERWSLAVTVDGGSRLQVLEYGSHSISAVEVLTRRDEYWTTARELRAHMLWMQARGRVPTFSLRFDVYGGWVRARLPVGEASARSAA